MYFVKWNDFATFSFKIKSHRTVRGQASHYHFLIYRIDTFEIMQIPEHASARLILFWQNFVDSGATD